MPRCRGYYHLVVATKGRQPLLTPSLRREVTELLRQKAVALRCAVHAVHVQPDYVHLALSIPPTQPVATVIGQLKGASCYAINHTAPRHEAFGWQLEYGLFTCSERHLAELVGYLERQDDHPARHTTIPAYEPSDEDERSRPRVRSGIKTAHQRSHAPSRLQTASFPRPVIMKFDEMNGYFACRCAGASPDVALSTAGTRWQVAPRRNGSWISP